MFDQNIAGERPKYEDNILLKTILMKGIPPGLQHFNICFEIDGNGILNVTVTHKESGNQIEASIDSRSSGKRDAKEISEMITKAERMKLSDQAQENRIFAMNKFISLCKEIKFDAQTQDSEENTKLLETVEDCLDWIEDFPNASESQILARYEQLLKESNKGTIHTKIIFKTK